MNAGGISIYEGSGSVTVISNDTVSLDIIVSPLAGNGSLELDIDWNEGDVQSPAISAVLIPVSGSARTLDFTLDGSSASFSASDVPVGYHSLSLKLMDNGALTFGAVEIVRIIKNQMTSGNFVFDNINMAEGIIDFNITVEQDNPLSVSISGTQDQMTTGQILELSAGISETGINAVYVWYVNGDIVENTANYSFSPSEAGVYRVDVTAITVDGKRGGCATYTIEAQAPEVVYSVRDIGPAGGYIIYDKGSYSDGWRYLEAASEDLDTTVSWGYWSIDIPGANGAQKGDGKLNTEEIMIYNGTLGYAAADANAYSTIYEGQYFDDWYLPAEDTLSLLYTELAGYGMGNFENIFYWSSTEASMNNDAVYIDLNSGQTNWISKNSVMSVRPVRQF